MNFTIENLAAYAVQIAIVIAAGALAPALFRLRAPKPLLAFWHLVLLSCVALPVLQPWKSQPVVALQNLHLRGNTTPMQLDPSTASSSWSLPDFLLSILAAGVLLRFLWLCAGFLKLRLYRRSARLLEPLPPEIRILRSQLAPDADLLVSDRLSSPVTFGLWNPAVLLPAKFLEFSPEVREAIVCHELLHIQRRDWLIAIAEECVRCVFWFHPAVWWLLGRIQLVREQVVDLAVIERTQQPALYVDALLVIATSKLQADLAPAPLFLKKRHLRQRVATIVQGVPMPKRLLVLSSLAVFSALPLIIGVAAWRFPLNAAPQQVLDAPGVELLNGPWTLLHRTGISYPREAMAKGVSGVVVVGVNVNSKGEVTDARVVSGPEELRRATLEAVLHWHFANSDWDLGNGVRKPAPPSFEMAIRFTAPTDFPVRVVRSAEPVTDEASTVEAVDVSSLPAVMQSHVLSVLPTPGARVTRRDTMDYTARLHEIDSHLGLTVVSKGVTGASGGNRNLRLIVGLPPSTAGPVRGVVAGIAGGVTGGAAGGVAGGIVGGVSTSPEIAAAPNPARRIRVGGGVQVNNLIEKVTPAYPPLAKQARISGTVRFDAVISREGRIINLHLVTGHPLLVQSATEAVSQWVYRPTLLNGDPVEVITQIDVNFTLSDSPPAERADFPNRKQ